MSAVLESSVDVTGDIFVKDTDEGTGNVQEERNGRKGPKGGLRESNREIPPKGMGEDGTERNNRGREITKGNREKRPALFKALVYLTPRECLQKRQS